MRHLAACLAATLTLLPLTAAADHCPQPCGKVVDLDRYEKEGKGSGLGAVAGGASGGNEVEKKSKSVKMQKVTVAMDNGGTQTFHMGEKSGYHPGARVHVVDGKLRVYTGK